MKNILPALVLYIIVCVIAMIAPASQSYNHAGWKLFCWASVCYTYFSHYSYYYILYKQEKSTNKQL